LASDEQTAVFGALENLKALAPFQRQVETVMALGNTVMNVPVLFRQNDDNDQKFKSELDQLIAALRAVVAVLGPAVANDQGGVIAVRIPPRLKTLADIAEFIQDLQRILGFLVAMSGDDATARVEFVGVDPGSSWLKIALGSLLMVTAVREAFDLSLKIAEHRNRAAQVLAAGQASDAVFQDGRRALDALTNSFVREQAAVYTKKRMRHHTPEDLLRTAHIFELLSGAIQKGAVVEPAKLESADAVSDKLFERVEELLRVAPEVEKLLADK